MNGPATSLPACAVDMFTEIISAVTAAEMYVFMKPSPVVTGSSIPASSTLHCLLFDPATLLGGAGRGLFHTVDDVKGSARSKRAGGRIYKSRI